MILWHKVCGKKTKEKLNVCEATSMGTWQCVSCAVYTESHVCMLNQSVTRIPLWCFSRSWRFAQRKREKEKLGSAVTGVGSEAHLPSFGSNSVLKDCLKRVGEVEVLWVWVMTLWLFLSKNKCWICVDNILQRINALRETLKQSYVQPKSYFLYLWQEQNEPVCCFRLWELGL